MSSTDPWKHSRSLSPAHESERALVLAPDRAFKEKKNGTFKQLLEPKDKQARRLVAKLCKDPIRKDDAREFAGSKEKRIVAEARVALKIAQVLLLSPSKLLDAARDLRRKNSLIKRSEVRRALLRQIASSSEVAKPVQEAAAEILRRESF